MKMYVLTCDEYDFLIHGFSLLFNKYWGSDQEVSHETR